MYTNEKMKLHTVMNSPISSVTYRYHLEMYICSKILTPDICQGRSFVKYRGQHAQAPL